MDSNEIDMEQSTTDLKYLWLLKKIVGRFLIILSNVYYFSKENSGDFKTTFVSIENTLVSDVGPAYEKLKDFAEQFIVFADDKLDKYAPSLSKKLVAEFESLINKIKPLVKILLTITQTVIIPLINTTIFLLQTTKYLILSITTTSTTKSTPVVNKTRSPLQKGLTTTQALLHSSPLASTTQTLLQNSLDTTQSLVPDTILQKAPDLANQARDITKSLVEGIPVVGHVAESLVSNPTDVANQIANIPNSLVNENPILETVNLAVQKSLDTTTSLVPSNILQKGPDFTNEARDTTKSLVEGIPLVGNAAQSIISNPSDVTNQIANIPNSLVNENPIIEAVNSAAQNSLDNTTSLVSHTVFQKGSNLEKQAQDTTKSIFGGIPLVGNEEESLVTNPANLANQIANTTNSLVNENPILEPVNSAAQKIIDTTASLVPNTIFQKVPNLPTQAEDKTKSLFGGIPLVGNEEESLATNPIDLANQIVNTTNSLVNENSILEVANLAAQSSLDTAESQVSDTILQKSPDLTNQALDATKSLVGGVPLVENAAQSLITNSTDLSKSLVPDTILQKGADLSNQTLDTAKSLVGGIPLVKGFEAMGTKSEKKSGWLHF